MKKKHKLSNQQSFKGLLFISPFVIGFIFFFLLPVFQSFLYSFGDLKSENNFKFAITGVDNFYRAFVVDSQFVRLVIKSVLTMSANVPIIIIFSFLIATMIKDKFPGRNAYRMIFFLPVIMMSGILPNMESTDLLQNVIIAGGTQVQEASSGVVSIMQMKQFLLDVNLNHTFVNYIITAVTSIFSIVNNSGVQILVFLAGLQSIPKSLYEASSIEGATGWEHFWKITFPMVGPQILVCVIYTIIDSFANVNNTVMQYIYDYSFNKFDFGYGAALSWIYFVIIVIALIAFAGTISRFVFYYDK